MATDGRAGNGDWLTEELARCSSASIGDTEFRHRHSRTIDDADSSMWGFQFYEHAHFLVLILGPAYLAKESVVDGLPEGSFTS
jgi:hypothetical protein